MKNINLAERACSFLGDKGYKSLQAHYHKNPVFRFAFISFAIISQVVGLVFVGLVGIVIGSLILSFLR